MSGSVKQRVVWFGSAPAFDLWAEELSSRWPERFSLRVHSGAECQLVQTQLIGTHWKNSVLGALAASQICGVTLAEAAEAMRRVEPVPGRMQPVRLPSGAVIIRDEFNGSIDTLQKALQFLAEARAGRRILVFSDMTDSSQRPRDRIARVAREAARFTGCVVFLGEDAKHGVRAAISAGMPPENVHGFMGFEAAVAFLRAELRPGDLVLLRSRFCDDPVSYTHLDVYKRQLVHRGPDEGAACVIAEMHGGLAVRRLSIVDLEHGSQPCSNEDSTVFALLNGEIYNCLLYTSRCV